MFDVRACVPAVWVWRMAVCIGDISGGDGAGVSPKLLSLSIALPELKLFWVSGR